MTAIATLGSHCSLQVLKGAKDEGLKTMLVCEKKREKLYRRFKFIDELIIVEKFSEILNQEIQEKLKQQDAILIPHGTLIAQMSSEEIESITVPIFGNKWILRWESDRTMKEQLMREATLPMPKPVTEPKDIEKLVIVKSQGAAGAGIQYHEKRIWIWTHAFRACMHRPCESARWIEGWRASARVRTGCLRYLQIIDGTNAPSRRTSTARARKCAGAGRKRK